MGGFRVAHTRTVLIWEYPSPGGSHGRANLMNWMLDFISYICTLPYFPLNRLLISASHKSCIRGMAGK